MAQNFLQPKGSINTKVDVSGLEQQLAKMFSAPQTETQPDPLRETVNEIVKTKLLNPVEVPKYTTLNDVLSANKGDKLGVFADFLDNPQTMRTIGTLLGGTYMDRRGNFVHGLEKQAAEREDLMKSEQQKALDEARQQNALAGSVYNAYNQMDIADMNDKRARELAEQELKWRAEEAEKDRAFRRQENAANRANSLAISQLVHGGGRGGISGLNEKQLKNIIKVDDKFYLAPGMSTSDKGKIRDNNAIIKSLDDGLDIIAKNPSAFGLKGSAPAVVQSIAGTKAGNQARSQIGGLAKEYKKYLTGVASNKTEEKDFLRYVPAPFDNAKTMEAKIKAIKNIAKSKNQGILDTFYYEEIDLPQNVSSDPLGLGL